MIENDSDTLNYIIPIITAIIGGVVVYIVAIKQNKSSLKIKKIDYLENKIKKLSSARENIITKTSDLPKNRIIKNEEMGSMAIDSTVNNIWQIQKISEYFDKTFIDNISNFNDEIQQMMGQAKMGREIDNEKAGKLVTQLPEINKTIRQELNEALEKAHKQLNSIF